MLHGGDFVLSHRRDINPTHIETLIEHGFIPVSVDYRLCPELNILEGPMTDVRDALEWARYELPQIRLPYPNLHLDGDRVVTVGWSSGGHLAMTLAWTAPALGFKAPDATLSFYGPSDFDDECKLFATEKYGGCKTDKASLDQANGSQGCFSLIKRRQ